MTVQTGLNDPYELFWSAVENNEIPFDQYENEQYTTIKKTAYATRLDQIVIGLEAAFFLYRHWITRNLGQNPPENATELQKRLNNLYRIFTPRMSLLLAPVIFSGYKQGVAEAEAGQIPDDYLYDVATNYSRELADHINEVSADAMVQGYQAQLNRKVASLRAWRNIGQTFGVPPRTMNSLVGVWSSEDPAKLTNFKQRNDRDFRAATVANKAIATRAQQIGDTEAWTARTQAKQLVWMYGQAHGIIPAEATRVWVTARDERVCPVCGPLHKQEAPVGEQFTTDAGNVWTPPLHPRCRCDVILSMNVPDTIEREYRDLTNPDGPLTAQVAIFKAARGDPYNRDNKGQFARNETRSKPFDDPRQLDPRVANLLREIGEKLDKPEEVLERVQLQARGKLKGGQLAPRGQLRGKLTPLEHPKQEEEIAPRAIRSRPLEPRGLFRPRVQLTSRTKAPAQSTFSPAYMRLTHPIFGMKEEWTGDLDVVKINDDHYIEMESGDFLHEDTKHAEESINEYWDRALHEHLSEIPSTMMRDNEEEFEMRTNRAGKIGSVMVTRDEIADAFYAYLERDLSRLNGMVELPYVGENGFDGYYDVPMKDIALYFGIDKIKKPLMIRMDFANVGNFDLRPGRQGWITNAGRWAVGAVYDQNPWYTEVDLLPPE